MYGQSASSAKKVTDSERSTVPQSADTDAAAEVQLAAVVIAEASMCPTNDFAEWA